MYVTLSGNLPCSCIYCICKEVPKSVVEKKGFCAFSKKHYTFCKTKIGMYVLIKRKLFFSNVTNLSNK